MAFSKKNKTQNVRLNAVAYEILVRCMEAGKGVIDSLLFPPRTMYEVLQRLDNPPSLHRVRVEISRLKDRKVLQERSKRYLAITPKGKLALYRYRLLKLRKGKRWDGRWFIVVFDIPELSRKDRDFLRNQLKLIGFLEMQKSVWIFPFDIREELKDLLHAYKKHFGGEVRFLVAQAIDDDTDLRKHFQI